MAYRTGPAATVAAAALARLSIRLVPLSAGFAMAAEDLTVRVARVEMVGVATDTSLRKAGGENLAEFMAYKPSGVNVNEVSGSSFQSAVTYRGFRASPVLGSSQGISVYLDGVRVNGPFGDVANWDMVPKAAIGELLLVPGANPLYGMNTLGRALAFRTKSGLTHPGGDAEFSASDQGRRHADLGHGWQGTGGWHGFVGATLFDDSGWHAHSAGRLGTVLLEVGRSAASSDWSVALLGGRSRMLGNGLLPDRLYRDDRRVVYTCPDTPRNRLLQGTLNFTQRFGRDSNLNAVAYVGNSRRDTGNGDIGGGDDEQQQCAAPHPGIPSTTSTRQDS